MSKDTKDRLNAVSATATELNPMNTMVDSNVPSLAEDIEMVSSPTDIPYPIRFRQVGDPIISKGEITFNYAWECNVEMYRLRGTIVGEKVTYPGGSPYVFPNPPFDEEYNNPTITGVEGSDALLSDTHHVPKFLYFSNFGEVSIDAIQYYTFRAPWMGEGQYQILEGPLTINRRVYKSGGEGWMYSCTKKGVTATIPALDAPTNPPSTKQQAINPDEELIKISTIKIDSTRGDLLELFRAPAGISRPFSATFQYRKCLNIFVDVVFEREYDENGQIVIGLSNRIISISAPYLKNTAKT